MMIWWAVFVLELSSIVTFWQILCHQLEMTLWRWFTQKMRVTAAWWCDSDSDPPAEPVLPHLEIVDRHCCHCANVISSTAASSWFYSLQQRDRFVRCHVSVQRSLLVRDLQIFIQTVTRFQQTHRLAGQAAGCWRCRIIQKRVVRWSHM